MTSPTVILRSALAQACPEAQRMGEDPKKLYIIQSTIVIKNIFTGSLRLLTQAQNDDDGKSQ